MDNIFEMEWITLDEDKKKCLMTIMRRATMPIQITSAYIIPVNLKSFMSVSMKKKHSIQFHDARLRR